MRTLLYQLPPELRNEVYNYLSFPEANFIPTVAGLPFQSRKFECKHTSVQICPVHFGSTGLLELSNYNFSEGREYGSWLLGNAVELRIGVVFKSRVNTFVQRDWNKKMEMHLMKLAKQYPWLRKVARYDIQILWDATDGPLKSKGNKRTAGQIPREMVRTLTSLMDPDVKKKRSNLSVRLHLEHRITLENAVAHTKFGLSEFLSLSIDGYDRLDIGISKRPFVIPAIPLVRLPLVPVPTPLREEKDLLVLKSGKVNWSEYTEGQLVLRKITGQPPTFGFGVGVSGQDTGITTDFILTELAEECFVERR